jgi:hypothetical protein
MGSWQSTRTPSASAYVKHFTKPAEASSISIRDDEQSSCVLSLRSKKKRTHLPCSGVQSETDAKRPFSTRLIFAMVPADSISAARFGVDGDFGTVFKAAFSQATLLNRALNIPGFGTKIWANPATRSSVA